MTKKKKPSELLPRGRKPKPINWEQLDKLCEIQCTGDEIAFVLGISRDKLDRDCKKEFGRLFSEVWTLKSAGGRASLRRKQFELAMAGDKTMLVWLGKQYLGQKDVIHQAIDPSDIELNIVHTVKNAET